MTTDTIPTLAHAARIGSDLSLYRERERAELVIAHAHGGVLVELVDRAAHERVLQELRRERDELAQQNTEKAARLAEIGLAEPVAWLEHELQGTGLRHLHFERRPNTLRDEVIAPVWTELIARPAPAAEPERAEPDSSGPIPSAVAALEFRRDQYALDQRQWALVLGLQPSHYSEVLSGRRTLPKSAMSLAYAYGVPAEALFQRRPTLGAGDIDRRLGRMSAAPERAEPDQPDRCDK